MRAASDETVPLSNPKSDHPLQSEAVGEPPFVGGKSSVEAAANRARAGGDVVQPLDFEEPQEEEEEEEEFIRREREVAHKGGEKGNVTNQKNGQVGVGEEGGKEGEADREGDQKLNVTAKGERSEGKESEKAVSKGASLKMTPEQIEKAKAARAAALKAEEEKSRKSKERTKSVLANIERLFVSVGTRTGAFKLGERVRGSAEVVVQDAIALGQKEKPSQQEKLKASAASAAKSVVNTVVKGWEEKVVPQAKAQLPDEYGGISNKALASVALGLFVAVALLPSLFGGGKPQNSPEKKKIEAETAVLEKKLARERAPSSYGSRSASQSGVFPSDGEDAPPKSKLSTRRKTESLLTSDKTQTPSGKVVEDTKGQIGTAEPAKPPSNTGVPPGATPPVPPAAEVSPKPQSQKEILKPVETTPAMVLTAVSKALGTNAGLVSSASFDSLETEPTVVLEVSRTFHQLPAEQQRMIADKVLKASRTLGYERVSFIEANTGMEVAHAGIDIDLEDEIDDLRAELIATRKQADKLSVQNTKDEAEIDALKDRLAQERGEYAAARGAVESRLLNLQKENTGLINELKEAEQEISKMPDSVALEEKTVEAEKRSDMLSDTVEMLSKQLTKAREGEVNAKEAEANSLRAVKDAEMARDEALASVTEKVETAQEEANRKVTSDLLGAQNEAKAATDLANKRVKDTEEILANSQRESGQALEETKASYEKKLVAARESRDKEVKSIQEKNEAVLKDVQRKAQANLDALQKETDKKMEQTSKEARATANSLTKERDQAIKATEKAQAAGEKALAKVNKEKENLQARITKLEAKLKSAATKAPNVSVVEKAEEAVGGGSN